MLAVLAMQQLEATKLCRTLETVSFPPHKKQYIWRALNKDRNLNERIESRSKRTDKSTCEYIKYSF